MRVPETVKKRYVDFFLSFLQRMHFGIWFLFAVDMCLTQMQSHGHSRSESRQAPKRSYKWLQMNLRRDVGNGISCAQSRFQVPNLAYGAPGIRCSTDPISSTIKSKIEPKQSENESDRSEQYQMWMSESERYRYVTCDVEESNESKKYTGECWSVN